MKINKWIVVFWLAVMSGTVLAGTEKQPTELTLKSINYFIKDNPIDPNLYFVKGELLFEKGRFKKAEQAYQQVLDLYPAFHEAHFELAKTQLKQKKYYSSLLNIDHYLELFPTDISAMIIKSEVLLNMGNFEDVIKITGKVLELDNYNGKAYLIKGEAEFELGNDDEARTNWQRAYDLGEIESGLHLRYLLEPVW